MIVSTGWFFLYRGNGYGPYLSKEQAVEMFREKHGCSPCSVVHPVYGTAHVENRRLIKFDPTISGES